MKAGEEISQKTYIHSTQMQTAVWRWGTGAGAGWSEQRRVEMGTSVIVSTIQIKFKKRNVSKVLTTEWQSLCTV